MYSSVRFLRVVVALVWGGVGVIGGAHALTLPPPAPPPIPPLPTPCPRPVPPLPREHSADQAGPAGCAVLPDVASLMVMRDATSEQTFTLTGVLQRAISIGGETTGWMLKLGESGSVELEFSDEPPDFVRPGLRVRVIGTLKTRAHVERGSVRVLHVTNFELLAR